MIAKAKIVLVLTVVLATTGASVVFAAPDPGKGDSLPAKGIASGQRVLSINDLHLLEMGLKMGDEQKTPTPTPTLTATPTGTLSPTETPPSTPTLIPDLVSTTTATATGVVSPSPTATLPPCAPDEMGTPTAVNPDQSMRDAALQLAREAGNPNEPACRDSHESRSKVGEDNGASSDDDLDVDHDVDDDSEDVEHSSDMTPTPTPSVDLTATPVSAQDREQGRESHDVAENVAKRAGSDDRAVPNPSTGGSDPGKSGWSAGSKDPSRSGGTRSDVGTSASGHGERSESGHEDGGD